ncbi:PAXIP1 [Mytilus edulis]|uniref:PAXIP1 n=1 Tax=Mytilus edulis TaxID=6550 RepID=A0A8S3UGL2_MYTED|nr:PAXIP1 [Mytilus edulis]
MIVEIKERKPTPTDENHDFHRFNKSKPEFNKRRNEYVNGNNTIPKKPRQEVANKENISLPFGNIIFPIGSLSSPEKQERRIILAPKELIVPPNPASYPPVLIARPQSVSTPIFNETTITNENVVINDNFSEENTESYQHLTQTRGVQFTTYRDGRIYHRTSRHSK